jgi:hypothetical protein
LLKFWKKKNQKTKIQGYIFLDMESSMLIDYLTNMCPYLLWYLNTSQSMHPTYTTLMPNATIEYLLMNGSKIHNFNAKYHHIINDFFFFFFFSTIKWEIIVIWLKFLHLKKIQQIHYKIGKIPKYIISQSMDPKSINVNAKYHNVTLFN